VSRTIRVLLPLVLGASASAQATPLADSVMKLEQAGLWDRASQFAQASYAKTTSPDERCALLVRAADALTHTGRIDTAGQQLEAFDRQCSAVASAGRYATTVGDMQREVSLPKLPVTGVEFSGVDQFWEIADILTKDVEPTDAEWHLLFSSVGYRLVMRRLSTTKSDLETALRPSKRAVFDSLSRLTTSDSSKLKHLARAVTHRAELARYRDSVAGAPPVQQAIALASRFLPPHATDDELPPLVAFALFSPDAYSVGPQALVIDLDQVYGARGLTELLAHEFHHSYLSRLTKVRFPVGDDPSAALVRALGSARNEGIADLIDKPHPLSVRRGSELETYAKAYNEAYARTPQVIRSIDSALVVAANDSSKLPDVGRRVQLLLPAGGHFNGSYMAREIYETFGVDSLYPGESNLFAFWRTYAEAEAKRGSPPPYSPKTVALLDALEKKYLRP
jgi:putative zinc-dependent peptidase DUF5700